MVSGLELGGGLLGQKRLTLQSLCWKAWAWSTQMLSKSLFLPLGEYPFSKVLPKPSRYMPGSGLGHSDAGDQEPVVHQEDRDMKDQPQFRDITVTQRVQGRLCSQWQGHLSWAL